jgi:ABC-2 type transport system ATP-binding protein
LIGRNGAGKTTLAKIIATLVRPTVGSVRVCGYDSVADEARVRSCVGLAAAEERSFYWRLTAMQNLTFFARLYGLDERAARTRIGALLEEFELTEIARRRFGELSTGNKQRMAVARAMLAAPPVLLLDEPTRSLDPVAAKSMRQLIARLAAGNDGMHRTTVLLTSHNLAEIEELCPRVGIISRGTIRALDTPANLRRAHPQSEQVRLTASNVTDTLIETMRAEMPRRISNFRTMRRTRVSHSRASPTTTCSTARFARCTPTERASQPATPSARRCSMCSKLMRLEN